jgi:hypothetical protein
MIIELNRHELVMCDLFGSIRRKNAMQFNYDRQVSKQNPYDMDIDGFMGEFVVAKYLNVMPDFTINEKKNAVDLIWNNKTIDVKTTRNPHGNVYVTEYHRKSPCDLYIQVVLLDAHLGEITGWIGKETMFDVATLVEGKHPSYCIKQADLIKENLSEFYYIN